MDSDATLEFSLGAVFGHVSRPGRLGDWLPQAARVKVGRGPVDVGHRFSLQLVLEGDEMQASGELIAYEPPWSVAYRLLAGQRAHVLRVTCSAAGENTSVHVHQHEVGAPLAVDFGRLHDALATSNRPYEPGK